MNTCSVREKAQEKVFSLLGEWRALKAQRPELIIGVGGCVASQEGEAITARAPFVDLVFGPQTLHRLPQMIARAARHGRAGGRRELSGDREVRLTCPRRAPRAHAPTSRSWKAAASTAASASCPTRAARKSAAASTRCSQEVRALAARASREVTLLGQNVNAYARRDGGRRRSWTSRRSSTTWRACPASSASASPPRIRSSSTTA